MKRKMLEALDLYAEDSTEPSQWNIISAKEITQTYPAKQLSDFVTPKTKLFFERIEIDTKFLQSDPSTWSDRAALLKTWHKQETAQKIDKKRISKVHQLLGE